MEMEDLEEAKDCDPSTVITAMFGQYDLEECPPEWLEIAAACLPELEIAFVAELNYSVCGNALYYGYSPAGSGSLIPEDWNGEWFPIDKAIASWEVSIKEAGEIDLELPDWVNYEIEMDEND